MVVIKKRVVIFCLNRSGIYHYATQLVGALKRSGKWDVMFVTSSYNKPDLIEDGEVVKKYIDAPHKPLLFLVKTFTQFFSKDLWNDIGKFKPDVIHVVDAYPWYLMWRKQLKKHPIILTIHDPVSHVGEVFGFVLNFMVRFLLRSASAVVVHGTSLKEQLATKYPQVRIQVIPHGNYGFFARWRNKKTPHRNRILFFGRILEYKGLHLLIDAVQELLLEGLDISLVIAGEGNASKYKKMVRTENSGRIIFENRYIEERQVADFFEESEIVVLPYLEATQSGVIPIAFSFGKPVVVTRVGALTEVVKDGINGLVVDPNNAKALKGAIKRLIVNEKLKEKLGQCALLTSNTLLSWEGIASQYGTEYARLINNEHV